MLEIAAQLKVKVTVEPTMIVGIGSKKDPRATLRITFPFTKGHSRAA
jgi:hypothetical protein